MPGILIADDYPRIRELLRSLVQTTGFDVCGEAENGADAIEKAKKFQPDLVLLDMAMPGVSGAEAASVIKRLFPHVKIILFTIHQDGVNQALARGLGIELALSKADTITSLKEHLFALLGPTNAATQRTPLTENSNLN